MGKEEKEDYEELISTEMSDEEADHIYKRYKAMKHENKIAMEDIREKSEHLY